MGYTVGNEFPNVCGKYPSIVELLELYYKLTAEYTQLLKEITDTNQKLDDYMNNINTMIPGWIDEATKEQQDRLNKLADDLQAQMAAQNKAINDLIAAYDARLDIQFKNQMSRVMTLLNQTTTWCTQQINEMKIWVRNEEDQMKKWTETRVSQLENRQDMQDAMIKALSNRVSYIEDSFDSAMVEINVKILQFMQEMRLWYYAQMYEDRKWVREQVDSLRKQVESIPQSSIPVDNYFTDEQSSMQGWIDSFWVKFLPYHGYTAMEWANRTDITCNIWQDARMTALEFYAFGKEVLPPMLGETTMISPVSGRLVPVSVAVNEVFNALNPTSIKAAEYDNWNMDAGHYDAQNITGKRYLDKDFQTDFN